MVPDRRRWLLPLLAALYLIPFPYFPAIHSPNEGSRLYQARALIDDGTFSVVGPLQRYGPVGDLARSDHGIYPNKAPGSSILGAGVYAFAKALVGWHAERLNNGVVLYLLRLGCCSLPTLIFLYFLRPLLWRWSEDGDAADLALCTYALGSLAYSYGLLYFSHQLAAVCLGGAFLCIEASRARERLWLLGLGGFLAGVAVLTEYTAALAALPLGIYVLVTARRRVAGVLAFGLASLPPQLWLLTYHTLAYGGPFRIGYQNNINKTFQSWHAQGFMGVTTPTVNALLGSFFSPAKGLLVFSPAMALGIWGIVLLLRGTTTSPTLRAPGRLLAVLFLLYSAFTASFIYEAWGWTVGPRHIAPLAAFLAGPLAVTLAAARKSVAGRPGVLGGCAVGVCVLSVLLTSLATITYPHFPEAFTNGIFEVTLPLLRAGYLPSNLLDLLLGLPILGWVLYFGALAVVVGWMLSATGGMRAVGLITALATVVVGVGVLSAVGRGESFEKTQLLHFIEQSYRAPQ